MIYYMIYSCENGFIEQVKFLLKNEANINANNAMYKKPIFIKTSDFIKTTSSPNYANT